MSDLHTDQAATATRLASQLEHTEATERLAGKLAAEEFRCYGWQSRALADEATLIDVRADLAAARAQVLRLTALVEQGLALAEHWADNRGEVLRRALTVAPGEEPR
ncbi:hypothetical protein QYN14_25740 [Rhodococcus ruber]|uniref:hypothetical protein n=1 Tax=Rhodococcus ruber TaxID=1830 RepID=UPI002657E526|nr:hypothetical protein [Rhodococcus ruber]WKK11953.1 hypothetical protein QYN14_25325 [Rhodococcus ruber]WKK12036.1 hypothetical protein QYN14_25740 [Rhodococcus ruber]